MKKKIIVTVTLVLGLGFFIVSRQKSRIERLEAIKARSSKYLEPNPNAIHKLNSEPKKEFKSNVPQKKAIVCPPPLRVDYEKMIYVFSRQQIRQCFEDHRGLLQAAKAIPYIKPGSGGEVHGFKMVLIRPNGLYDHMGLEKGDVIHSVNDHPLNSPQKVMELYEMLKSKNEFRFEILRNNKPLKVIYRLE